MFRSLDQLGSNRIFLNIFDLCLPIIGITYAPIVEANLPHFHFLVACSTDLIGAAALDELHCLFKGCCWAWSQK